jgi:hypothetical protein
MSQRRMAKFLKISRTTVERKFRFLAMKARAYNQQSLGETFVTHMQFDDLETFENSKCKPVSVTMAVEKSSRKILGFEASQMPAKGHLARIARKKYGYRRDDRALGRRKLFHKIKPQISEFAEIYSDQNPHYLEDVRKFFPNAVHKTTKGRRGCVVGQGDLKAGGFDLLFSLNHIFAMLRANINRLVRKTWCTTKKLERLSDHIHIYVKYHSQKLIN